MADIPSTVEPVLAFLNTADLEGGDDALADPAALTEWLRRHGLQKGTEASSDDVALALALREGLRDAVEGQRDEPQPVDRLGSALAALPVVLDGDLRPHPAPDLPPVRAALAELVCTVLNARAEGVLDRVKVCARDSCRWAFWDSSRNRSHTWCSMRVCGNREKMRRRAQRAAE